MFVVGLRRELVNDCDLTIHRAQILSSYWQSQQHKQTLSHSLDLIRLTHTNSKRARLCRLIGKVKQMRAAETAATTAPASMCIYKYIHITYIVYTQHKHSFHIEKKKKKMNNEHKSFVFFFDVHLLLSSPLKTFVWYISLNGYASFFLLFLRQLVVSVCSVYSNERMWLFWFDAQQQ